MPAPRASSEAPRLERAGSMPKWQVLTACCWSQEGCGQALGIPGVRSAVLWRPVRHDAPVSSPARDRGRAEGRGAEATATAPDRGESATAGAPGWETVAARAAASHHAAISLWFRASLSLIPPAGTPAPAGARRRLLVLGSNPGAERGAREGQGAGCLRHEVPCALGGEPFFPFFRLPLPWSRESEAFWSARCRARSESTR
jgi:hypothetical protein